LSSFQVAAAMANLLESKQAGDVRVMDVSRVSSVADYFVVGTVYSKPQMRAIASQLRDIMAQWGLKPIVPTVPKIRRNPSGWTLLDYGDVVVHLFTAEDRQHYQLERFWNPADILDAELWREAWQAAG
jgi:ribosome-associated protein